MNVSSTFKPQGEDVRILVLHSTKNDLGKDTVALLRSNLNPKIAVAEHRIPSLSDLATMPQPQERHHVVLLVVHGDSASNQAWLFGDVDVNGEDIGTNAGVLRAASDGLLDDCLCLLGVCHFGQDLLQEAIVDRGGALACVAPKPGCTISKLDIGNEFAKLLNAMQTRRSLDIGVDDLEGLLRSTLTDDLYQRLVTYTAAT